jgi:glycosyltransferase involved in cell wall biosynthesis
MSAAILHLLGTAMPEGTGIARIVAALAGGLDPAKYHVHAWFLGPPGPLVQDLEAAGATARSTDWSRGARDPVGAYRFWRSLRKYNFLVVHQHFGARSIRRLISVSSNASLVVHLHGRISAPDCPRSVPVAVQGADVIIAASRAIAFDIAALKPIVVHAGIPSLMGFHAKDKSSQTTIIIGAACRLVPLKGVLDLIRAVSILSLEFPHLRLEIAGAGPERGGLEAEASRLGLHDRVRFLGWQTDLTPMFQKWDIFAMPSLEEGFGMAALEAMAGGLPVVAARVGGLPEVIEDCHTGYLVPPSDVAALVGRLRLLILQPERRQAMGAAARERVRDYFSVHRMVAEIQAIYDSLVAQQVN